MNNWIRKNLSLLLRGLGTLLALGLLVFLVAQSDQEEIFTNLKKISFQTLGLVFLFIVGSRLFITARWFVLLRSGGIKISFKETLSLVFMGLFSNNFLPTTIGGDVVRLAGAIQLGYDNALCLASIAADRVINMVGMSLAAPLGLWQLAGISALGQSFALGGLVTKGVEFSKKTLSSFSLWLKKPGALVAALMFAFIHMFFSFTASYLLIVGQGEYLALWKVIGLSSLAYFVSLVPISINGYGVQELTVTFLLSSIGGISVPTAASTAVIHRLVMMSVSLPGAFTLPGVLAKMNRKGP
jgi:uncharacterized membrane protein YbhN (UPF0104 family)